MQPVLNASRTSQLPVLGFGVNSVSTPRGRVLGPVQRAWGTAGPLWGQSPDLVLKPQPQTWGFGVSFDSAPRDSVSGQLQCAQSTAGAFSG